MPALGCLRSLKLKKCCKIELLKSILNEDLYIEHAMPLPDLKDKNAVTAYLKYLGPHLRRKFLVRYGSHSEMILVKQNQVAMVTKLTAGLEPIFDEDTGLCTKEPKKRGRPT